MQQQTAEQLPSCLWPSNSRDLLGSNHKGIRNATYVVDVGSRVHYSEGAPEVVPFAQKKRACGRRASSPETGLRIDGEDRPSPAMLSLEHGPRGKATKVLEPAHRPAAQPSETEHVACMPEYRSSGWVAYACARTRTSTLEGASEIMRGASGGHGWHERYRGEGQR